MADDQRKNEAVILALVHQIHDKVELLNMKLEQHMNDETTSLAAEIKRLMERAFPDGDPDGHKAAHDAWIKKTEERAEFYKKMTFELSKGGLVVFAGWALLALWRAFLSGPK